MADFSKIFKTLITDITRNSTDNQCQYFYDALGNRIGEVFDLSGTANM